MEIREFKLEDKKQIKDLLVELQKYVIEIDKYKLNILSPSYRDKYFDYMLEDCKTQNGKIFVATDNEKVVAFISGFIQTYDERDLLDYTCPKKGIVAELIVDKNYRSCGIGNSLLSTIENYFKQLGCKFIQIDVFAYNENAKHFYQKHNYEDRMVTMFKQIK